MSPFFPSFVVALQHLNNNVKLYGKTLRVALSKHSMVQLPKEGQPVSGLVCITSFFLYLLYSLAMQHLNSNVRLYGKTLRVALSKHSMVQLPKDGQSVSNGQFVVPSLIEACQHKSFLTFIQGNVFVWRHGHLCTCNMHNHEKRQTLADTSRLNYERVLLFLRDIAAHHTLF